MQIEKNIDLKPYNTLQIPVIAKYFVRIKNESEIIKLMQTDLWKEEKHYILNWGANILFTHNINGIIIKIDLKSTKKTKRIFRLKQ